MDKDRERWYLQRLRLCLPELPEGDATDFETPDFLIGEAGERLGVEFTEFHLPPPPSCRPHQETESLRARVVKLADELHAQSGGPGAYVSAYFDDRVAIRKGDVTQFAQALSEVVLCSPIPPSPNKMLLVPPSDLPRGISRLEIWGSADGVDRLWDSDTGGWVATVSHAHIQAVIKRKAGQAHNARLRCERLWLVIVRDLFAHSAPSDLSRAAVSHEYRHPFDRLLWFEPEVPRVFDLGVSEPDV